jgi:cytochrome c55X
VPPPLKLAAATFAALLALAGHAADPATGVPDEARRGELVRLIRQDCGACHGMQLTGGLGPPITPAALKDKPVASLRATILDGRRGTAMPPWRPFLTEEEAAWMAALLVRGIGDAQ